MTRRDVDSLDSLIRRLSYIPTRKHFQQTSIESPPQRVGPPLVAFLLHNTFNTSARRTYSQLYISSQRVDVRVCVCGFILFTSCDWDTWTPDSALYMRRSFLQLRRDRPDMFKLVCVLNVTTKNAVKKRIPFFFRQSSVFSSGFSRPPHTQTLSGNNWIGSK
jgi:hypothetical protein